MGLQRVGVLLLALGLLLTTLSAVAFGINAGGTEAYCEDHEPSYALVGVESASLSVSYTDGCNIFSVQPLVTAGLGVSAGGLLVGGVGIGRQRLQRE